jgi:hypothetical protein
MSLGTILLIVIILALVGALPMWPYSSGWGYYPTGGLGLLVVIILVLLLLGRIWSRSFGYAPAVAGVVTQPLLGSPRSSFRRRPMPWTSIGARLAPTHISPHVDSCDGPPPSWG